MEKHLRSSARRARTKSNELLVFVHNKTLMQKCIFAHVHGVQSSVSIDVYERVLIKLQEYGY